MDENEKKSNPQSGIISGSITYIQNPYPRCECHKCVQARAKMQLGSMWDIEI